MNRGLKPIALWNGQHSGWEQEKPELAVFQQSINSLLILINCVANAARTLCAKHISNQETYGKRNMVASTVENASWNY